MNECESIEQIIQTSILLDISEGQLEHIINIAN